MSVEEVTLALGGLVLGYAGHESSGTNLDDFSPSNLDATLSTRGALAATAILAGSARAVAANGDAGSGNVATRAVAGGSPLQLASGITVMACVRPRAFTPSGVRGFLGERPNNWLARWDSSRRLNVLTYIGGVLQTQVTGRTALAAGERGWPWFSFDGRWLKVGMNDAVENAGLREGSINATTDALSLFASSSIAFVGDWEYFLIFNRALEEGERRAIVREGDATMDYASVSGFAGAILDFSGDGNALIAASDEDALCPVCSGRIRELQARVTDDDGVVYHDGCRSTQTKGTTPVINASSVQAAYGQRLERVIRDCLSIYIKRSTTSKTTYWNGTDWVIAGGNPAHNSPGIGLAAAALGRYLGASRSDPLMKIATKSIETIWQYDNQNGLFYSNGDFTLGMMGRILVLLEGRMDPVLHAEWVDRYVAAVIKFEDGGNNSNGTWRAGNGPPSTTSPVGWYINGNRMVPTHTWCAWRLTGDSNLEERYETGYDWWLAPAYHANYSPSGETFGRVIEQAGSEEDGSDAAWYFKEAHDQTTKGFWNIGTTADNDGTQLTVNVNGKDPGYVGLNLEYVGWMAAATRDIRYFAHGNAQRNSLDFGTQRLNQTTWIVQGDLGSRHCSDYSWSHAIDHVAMWRGRRTASPWSASYLAASYIHAEAVWLSKAGSPTSAGEEPRSFGLGVAAFLMGLDKFPRVDT